MLSDDLRTSVGASVSTLIAFPLPACRTEPTDSVRGSRSRSCPRSREATLPHLQACQAVVHPQPLLREAHVVPRLHLVLPTLLRKGDAEEGSTASEEPTPQAATEPDGSALLQQLAADRREEKNRTAVRGVSDHHRTARTRVRWTVQAGRAFCRSARSLSLRPSLADAHPPRALRAQG